MTDHEKLVMRNIIYAVETGGQVYGQKNYADFTEAYTNSSSEHAITIGAGQWYGNEARTLLLNIKAADAATFKKHDTAGVAADLAKTDWSNYRLSKTSAKAKAIVNIINSTVGRRCQDQLMDTQMEAYVKEAAALGVSNMDAKMMCANFRHQGGASAVKRILAKTTKPYTLDHLYAACQTDTGNQVGAYKSRQKMVYNALKTYITNYKVTAAEAIQAAIKIAKAEIGYLEKKSNANLDSKTANAGTANYTKYWRDADPANQASPWCACFISWVFMKAFGKATATKLLKHWPYIYVPTLAGLFTNYASPKVGDIFMYHNGSEFSHTGLVISVSGDKFVTIEGNTNDGSGVVAEGIGVYQKTRYNSQLPGSKFARPNYSIVTSINGSGGDITPPSTWVTTGTAVCTGDDVYVRQTPGGTVMGMVSKGTKLELDGTSSGVWVHVKVAGIGIGYMHQDYVGKDSGSTGSSPIKTAQNALFMIINPAGRHTFASISVYRNSNVLSVFHIISNFQFQIRCQWSALFPAFSYLNIGIADIKGSLCKIAFRTIFHRYAVLIRFCKDSVYIYDFRFWFVGSTALRRGGLFIIRGLSTSRKTCQQYPKHYESCCHSFVSHFSLSPVVNDDFPLILPSLLIILRSFLFLVYIICIPGFFILLRILFCLGISLFHIIQLTG